MTTGPPDFRELYRTWMRIRNKMDLMEHMTQYFGLEEPFHLSEIHTIQAIGNTPENNIRTIADILGVTPSAASQVVTRLTKRGLVNKVRGVRNEKEVSIELTDNGWIAFKNHEQVHRKIFEQISERIGPLNEKDRVIIGRIFSSFESVYDELIESRAGGRTV
jgi:DNA-binding MarR family transcriptional regulator